MNKFETGFGTSEIVKNSARAFIVATLMFASPVEAAEPKETSNRVAVAYPKTPENQFKDGLRWIGIAKTDEMRKRTWIRLAETVPAKTLENSELIDLPYVMEVIKVAANTAAEKDPVGFLQHAVYCTDLPNYLDLLKKAAKKAADIDPKATLSLSDRFGDFPWGKPILAKAKKNLEAKETKEKLVKK